MVATIVNSPCPYSEQPPKSGHDPKKKGLGVPEESQGPLSFSCKIPCQGDQTGDFGE